MPLSLPVSPSTLKRSLGLIREIGQPVKEGPSVWVSLQAASAGLSRSVCLITPVLSLSLARSLARSPFSPSPPPPPPPPRVVQVCNYSCALSPSLSRSLSLVLLSPPPLPRVCVCVCERERERGGWILCVYV